MKPLYPRTKCKFCGLKLKSSSVGTGIYKSCRDNDCYLTYYYQIYREDRAISYHVGPYIIFIYNDKTMSIYVSSCEIHNLVAKMNKIIDINKNNYLDQIIRIERLQVFK